MKDKKSRDSALAIFRKTELIFKGECLIWPKSTTTSGYGQIIVYNADGNQTGYLSHRLAYENAFGPIPKGKLALHTCDTPKCCNPHHIWVGTQSENMADRTAKKRHRCFDGRLIPKEEAIAAIKSGLSSKKIAIKLGFDVRSIEKFKKRHGLTKK